MQLPEKNRKTLYVKKRYRPDLVGPSEERTGAAHIGPSTVGGGVGRLELGSTGEEEALGRASEAKGGGRGSVNTGRTRRLTRSLLLDRKQSRGGTAARRRRRKGGGDADLDGGGQMQVKKLQAEKDPWGGGVLERAAAMLRSLTERNKRGE